MDVVTSLDKVGVHEESKERGDEDVERREEEEKSTHRLQRLYLNSLVDSLLLSGVALIYAITWLQIIMLRAKQMLSTRNKRREAGLVNTA
jgi:hypothetical protein